MNDFKKRNKFGGGAKKSGGFAKNKFDKNRGGNSRGFGGGDFKRDMEMYSAVCASCSKNCEVPFRPNGKKPVYCKDCFSRESDGNNTRRFESNRNSSRADSYNRDSRDNQPRREQSRNENDTRGLNDLKNQIEILNSKLEKIIMILGEKNSSKKESPVEATKEPKKLVSKKSVKKSDSPTRKKKIA